MRAVLVVNPHATATSPRVREVLVHALAGAGPHWDVDVIETTHRGHAIDVASAARRDGLDLVMTLGGDGTVNEAVNGLLAEGPGDDVPLLAVIPGGSANVFARALGLPANAVEATGAVLEALSDKQTRTIGLGLATIAHEQDGPQTARWMCFNAGLGVDAEIIAAMEDARAEGQRATAPAYVRTALRHLFLRTDRRSPALTLHRPGVADDPGIFLAIIANTSPWTYLGPVPVRPLPAASFDSGLDLWALRTLATVPTLRYFRRMMMGSAAGSTRAGLTVIHDAGELSFSTSRPIQLQIDGDGLGLVRTASFRSVPAALRVVC